MSVHLTTLGQLRVTRDRQDIPLPVQRRVRAALLVYLAIEREVTREKLATVFWPDSDEEKARHALSQALYHLRQILGDEWLISTADRLRVSSTVQVDADVFARAVQDSAYDVALKLYGGPFLSDVDNLPNNSNFESWVEAQRAHVERLHRQARREVIRAKVAESDQPAAINAAREWVRFSPAEDEAHHKLIELLAQSGQVTEAIRHFESYERQLAKEDLRPLDETSSLINSLSRTDLASRADAVAHNSPAEVEAALPWLHSVAGELKRRHVLRVLTAYIVVSWGAIEVSATTFPLAGLPDWAPGIVLWIVLGLFPLVAILAWMYDITPRGVVRTDERGVPARSITTRRFALGIVAGGMVLWGGFEARSARLERVGDLVEELVLVLPFRVLVSDSSFQPLGEGIVDLLATKLAHAGVARAVDPATAVALSRKQPDAAANPDQRRELARSLGARHVMTGSAVVTLDQLTLSATMEDAAYDRPMTASVSGPVSKTPQLIDDLAAKVLGIAIQERQDRLESLTTASFPALQSYLQGMMVWRRSGARASAPYFEAALEYDSTFALAALRLSHLGRYNQVGGTAAADRALRLAWVARDRLSARDKTWLQRTAGPNYPRWYWRRARVQNIRETLAQYPDLLELWEDLGDLQYHGGFLDGASDPLSEAQIALVRALALDSTLTEPRIHLFEIAAHRNDTATLRRLQSLWLRKQSTHPTTPFMRWQVAAARRDTATLDSLRREFDNMHVTALGLIADAAMLQGQHIEDADRAVEVMRQRGEADYWIYALDLALNGGRSADVTKLLSELIEQGVDPNNLVPNRIRIALLTEIDTLGLGNGVARWEETLADNAESLPVNEPARGRFLVQRCIQARWHLHRGNREPAERLLPLLRRATMKRDELPSSEAQLTLCAAILEASLDVQAGKRSAALQRLDSLSRTGVPLNEYNITIGLIVSRLWEKQGDFVRAHAAAKRRWIPMTMFLAPHLKQEARMAALIGDHKGAIRAYRHYLALRPNPDDKSEDERVRAELARLQQKIAARN